MLPRTSKVTGDILVFKGDRVMAGVGIQTVDDLWVKTDSVFVKVPNDYGVGFMDKLEFAKCVEGREMTSTPEVGDVVVWQTGGRFFFIERTVDEVLYDEVLGEILIVSVFGVRQPVAVKSSAIYRLKMNGR